MLREILPAYLPYKRSKRWFSCRDIDLFVCFHQQTPNKFLISYNRLSNEHSLQWVRGKGFQHFCVDTGDQPEAGYKQSPLLQAADENVDIHTISRCFLQNSGEIDAAIAEFVYDRLLEYPAAYCVKAPTPVNQDSLQEKQ